jgi:hypothetical protein
MRWAVAGYLVVFALLDWSWLARMSDALPGGTPTASLADNRLITWALAWVAHALVTDPRHLFDANIFHPAPAQLTGSDYYPSSQIAFAPIFWLTGNAVVAANTVALLSYPLAALAMERLLVALGCSAAAAWIAGLIFALGPLQIPRTIHVLQYLHLYLPLAALALRRLRDQPTAAPTLVCAAVLMLGFLSSYYMAVMLGIGAGVWAGFEFLRPGPGRSRFACGAVAAGGLALTALVLASMPYFARREAALAQPFLATTCEWARFHRFALVESRRWFGVWPLALAGAGALALGAREPAAAIARRGAAMTLVALVFMLGPAQCLGGITVLLPFAALAASPAHFFRLPVKFSVLGGFGTALLAGAALEALQGRFGSRPGRFALTVVAIAILAARGHLFASGEFAEHAVAVHDRVREAVRDLGAGPLLELPLIDARGRHTEDEAMVGSTRHWLPLVAGYTGYDPPHRPLLVSTMRRLPASEALDDLVDMTHLTWLLLRPADMWPVPAARDALLGANRVRPVLSYDGWTLARVEREPRHSEWFAALAAGPRADRTLLGTPRVRLPRRAAVAQVLALQRPTTAPAGSVVALVVQVRNSGSAAWPIAVAPDTGDALTVALVSRWHPRSAGRGSPSSGLQRTPLGRDVASGETVSQALLLVTPAAPGTYALEVAVEQIYGARFHAEGNRPLRLRLQIVGHDAAMTGATLASSGRGE